MSSALRIDRASLLILVAGIGCSGGGISNSITQTVGKNGAEISVTAAGDKMLAGTTLTIPAGALTVDTVITVSRGADQAAALETALGPSVRLSPDGLMFAKPATLTLPYFPSAKPIANAVVVSVTTAAGKSKIAGSAVTVDATAGTATVEIAHFSDYQVLGVAASGDGGIDGGPIDGGGDGLLHDGGPVDLAGPPDGGVDLAPPANDLN